MTWRVPGPFAKTIEHFGETLGLAVGLFAECSTMWEVFANYFAHERALVAKRRSGTVQDLPVLTTRYYHAIVQHWGSLAAREQVRLRLCVARDLAGPTLAKAKSLWQRRQDYSAQRLIEGGRLTMPFCGMGFVDWE